MYEEKQQRKAILNGEGKTQWSGLTVEEYNQRYQVDAEAYNLKDACELIDAACVEKYVAAWKEVSEERYWEMLEVLPPEEFTRFTDDYNMIRQKGVGCIEGEAITIFRLCEYQAGDITAHFATTGGKYYESCLKIGSMKEHALDLLKSLKPPKHAKAQ